MTQSDISAVTHVHHMAFGQEEGAEIAELAGHLLALPETVSINAIRDEKLVGNVLFTPFVFQDHPDAKCYLLAPNGVVPQYQGQGVGRELMETGIAKLRSMGVEAIFVLGVPDFYPKYGFVPTDKQSVYPDLLTMPEAWMALELKSGALASLSGKTTAVEPFMQPELWDTSGHE